MGVSFFQVALSLARRTPRTKLVTKSETPRARLQLTPKHQPPTPAGVASRAPPEPAGTRPLPPPLLSRPPPRYLSLSRSLSRSRALSLSLTLSLSLSLASSLALYLSVFLPPSFLASLLGTHLTAERWSASFCYFYHETAAFGEKSRKSTRNSPKVKYTSAPLSSPISASHPVPQRGLQRNRFPTMSDVWSRYPY